MELLVAAFDYIPSYEPVDFIEEGTEMIIEERYDESPEWIVCSAVNGQGRGWFPARILEKKGEQILLKETFSPDELEIYKGEYLIKISEEFERLYVMNSRNEKGWIPKIIVKTAARSKDTSV